MDIELQEFIKQTIKEAKEEAASTLMKELTRNKMIKPNKDSAFQKTEKLLYNYNQFKKVIADKQEQIDIIAAIGLSKRSKSIVKLPMNQSYDTRTDAERAEDTIEQIQASMVKVQEYIQLIDNALEKVSNDEYFELIELYYFEGQTREEIADYFEVDVSTISRHRKRLVNNMKIYLFPDDSIMELFD